MSISAVQKRMQLNESMRKLFSNGEKPFVDEVLNDASKFFSTHPIGRPYSIQSFRAQDNLKSDSKVINTMAYTTLLNAYVLYQACEMQARNIEVLTQTLINATKQMKQRRKVLESLIDDHLLSIYNADGYFYSIGEKFSNLDNIDLNLTSAYVDVSTNIASIPALANGTRRFTMNNYRTATLNAFLPYDEDIETLGEQGSAGPAAQPSIPMTSQSDFINCLDLRDDTWWHAECRLDKEETVALQIDININAADDKLLLSRIEAELYGITETKMFVETAGLSYSNNRYTNFGDKVSSGTEKLVFTDEAVDVSMIRIFLLKSQADVIKEVNGKKEYHYTFGFKNLFLLQNTYDIEATLVSEPFTLPEEMGDQAFIDAVSLVADYSVPANTSIDFYVASDDGSNVSLGDFTWKQIQPVKEGDSDNKVVRYDGTVGSSFMIKSNPQSSDLQLLPIDLTNPQPALRNPSPTITGDEADVYKICKFSDTAIESTLTLEEGINTTKIYYRDIYNDAVTDGLSYWADKFDSPSTHITYGTIDSGDGFFYGGDVGENGKSIFVETYVDSATFQRNIIKDFKKLDANAKYWHVKLYLNGNEIAELIPGAETVTVPWTLKKGLNHIIMLINIPLKKTASEIPFSGVLSLMDGDHLYSYGTVKLANWRYVDLFQLKFNESGQPKTFSIYDGYIVSRRKPSNNFRLKYSKSTGFSPQGIRFRCDMKRALQNPSVTPTLKSYRLRFAYGEIDE